MNTIPTLCKRVRKCLMELGVPYLRYNYNCKKWHYWNNYLDTGMTAWQDREESSSGEEVENPDEEESIHNRQD